MCTTSRDIFTGNRIAIYSWVSGVFYYNSHVEDILAKITKYSLFYIKYNNIIRSDGSFCSSTWNRAALGASFLECNWYYARCLWLILSHFKWRMLSRLKISLKVLSTVKIMNWNSCSPYSETLCIFVKRKEKKNLNFVS